MAKLYYEYYWNITFNIPSRNIQFKPYSLCRFEKHSNYFDNFMPTYNMICKIYDKDLDIFRLLDKELSVTIILYVSYGENKDSLTTSKKIGEYEFACYCDKSKIPSYTSSSKKVNSSVEKPKSEYEPETLGELNAVELNLSLLLKKDVEMRTFIHNRVFGSSDMGATPMTAVMALIEQNPYVDNCLIDKPTNTLAYRDLIVKPDDLKNAILGIQHNYGIYDKSIELFYDNGMLYVLNKLENHHSKAKNEISEINVKLCEKVGVPNSPDYVVESSDEKKIYYERRTKILKEDYESIEGALYGDKFVYANFASVINSGFSGDGKTQFKSPLNEVLKPRQSRIDVGTKIIPDYDMLNNAFNMSSYMYEKSLGVPISFVLTGINADHLSPNKNIRILCDTPESHKLYSGLYNIANVELVYENVSKQGKNFTTYCSAILKLVNKTEGYDEDYQVGEKKLMS